MSEPLYVTTSPDYPLTEEEAARAVARIAQWQREGGVLILPPGCQLYAPVELVRRPAEGVSEEGADWGEEVVR